MLLHGRGVRSHAERVCKVALYFQPCYYMGEVFDHMLKRCERLSVLPVMLLHGRGVRSHTEKVCKVALYFQPCYYMGEVFDHMLKGCIKSLCTSSHVITWERCSITC